MTHHFKVGDDVETNDGAGRIVNRQDGNFHVQLQQGIYVYTAQMMKPLEEWKGLDTHSDNELHMGQFCYPGVDPSLVAVSPFEQSVRRHTDRIANLLIEKNKAYGDSALNPIRVFSKADRMEQLYIRLDDKISRIQKGTDFANEDTIDDLIGYLFLLKIAKESA